MRDLSSPMPRSAWPVAAWLLLLGATATAQQPPAKDVLLPEDKSENQVGMPRPVEVVPSAPDAQSAKKPIPRAQRILIRTPDGKKAYVYKCGDEFTDSPVCGPHIKPSTMLPTQAERDRCKTFRTGNFIPWYCR